MRKKLRSQRGDTLMETLAALRIRLISSSNSPGVPTRTLSR